MSAFATLSSSRICVRRWCDEDRDAFAAMNSDARVMEFFPSRLSRVESDAMVDRIQEYLNERGFGLWAIEVPGFRPSCAAGKSSTPKARTLPARFGFIFRHVLISGPCA